VLLLNYFTSLLKLVGGEWREILIIGYAVSSILYFLYKKYYKKESKRVKHFSSAKELLSSKYRMKIDIVRDSILRDQMNFAENELEILSNKQLKKYKQILIDKIKLNPLMCEDTTNKRLCSRAKKIVSLNEQAFNLILECIQKILINETRRAFKENGFDEMTDDAFTLYLENIIAKFLEIGEKTSRNNYSSILELSYEDGTKAIDIYEVSKTTEKIFKNAKSVKLKSLKKIEILVKKYDEDVDNLVMES
jgi:hypothetical protein